MKLPATTHLKYLVAFSLPLTLLLAYLWRGPWTFLPLAYAFGLVPLLELLLNPQESNLDQVEEQLRKADPWYDWLVYATVPVQYAAVFGFLWILATQSLQAYEVVGLITALGVMCGVFGINVGHELGHRRKPSERYLAQAALLTSLYTHFFIEHNRGHHKHVSTELDPASARWGETVYGFWLRSVIGGYQSAWHLEQKRLQNKRLPVLSWHNQMVRLTVLQGVWLLLIGLLVGPTVLGYYVLAAVMGFLLLETVNYIEHYGLQRKSLANGGYERVQPHHSWNSNHVIGRLLLFELSR
ncbi:MAG: alkane 1-monooxygenase, partial [Bacteroidota bacterium]